MQAWILFIFLLLGSYFASAQKFIQAGWLGGRIIENHPEFPHVKKISSGIELRAGMTLNGSKPWHRAYRFADAGLMQILVMLKY